MKIFYLTKALAVLAILIVCFVVMFMVGVEFARITDRVFTNTCNYEAPHHEQ